MEVRYVRLREDWVSAAKAVSTFVGVSLLWGSRLLSSD